MSIATNLRREMDAHAVSVAALAASSGVEASFVRKYLAGKIKPSEDVVERLARSLGCEASDLADDRPKHTSGKIYPEDAARRLGRSAQDIRVGLQLGTLPFGVAYKRPGARIFTYEINPAALEEYAKAQEAAWAGIAGDNT